MINILFICHGNICRSPLAEFIMKDLVKKEGFENDFYIASSATSTEEIGNPVYPPIARILDKLDINYSGKRATQVKKSDYDKFDYLICMDGNNLRNLSRIIGSDTENKVHLLLDFADGGYVSDPWYSGDFETCLKDVSRGCEALLKNLKQNHKI